MQIVVDPVIVVSPRLMMSSLTRLEPQSIRVDSAPHQVVPLNIVKSLANVAIFCVPLARAAENLLGWSWYHRGLSIVFSSLVVSHVERKRIE
jgi:hypothetical protein